MIKIIFVLLILLAVLSCNVGKNFKEMSDKQGKMQKSIKDNYGLSSQVGWNVTNGVLTQITITFNNEEVKEEPVSKLTSVARETIEQAFDEKPKVILIQIACNP
jgi:hypothetical protein